MNLNSQIDWSDTDRIVSNDTRYVSLNGDWWRESSSWQTRQNGSSALTRVGLTRTRLTGLASSRGGDIPVAAGVLTSETHSLDPLNNETVSCSYLDRSSHTTTQTTTTPASSLPAVATVQSGLTVSSRSATGVTTTYAYDALGRQISQTDGRGNTSQIVYDAQGRVAKTIDPLGNETTYAHDALGRQTAVTDPLGHTVTTIYDAEGRVVSQRGATYPVDYAYDAYGNKVSMTTYRDEELVDGDTTHWLYDEPSGCMTNKLYADGKGPRYDYTPDGKLARRIWARGIATDYAYDNAGNLTRTEYDDNGVTPTITMSYDRVGNLTEATTAGVVTNLYAYNLVGNCTNEWQNDFNLTRYYDTLGRSTGYAINGTRQTTIAYDTYGRISTMTTPTGGVLCTGAAAAKRSLECCVPPAQEGSGLPTASNGGEFRWTYLPNSDLKSSLTYPNGLTASWQYDANNQLIQVCNATPTNVISQFDYTYDAAGRRTAITKTGSAFGDLSGSVDSYTYNARSELTSARRTKNGQPIPGFSEDFDYDPIGNRRSSATYNEKGEAQTSTYAANNLNQYTSRTTPGYAAVRGEADPNATVTVNENPTFRLGYYYFGSDLFDNNSAGGLANLETYATLGQFVANGDEADDLVSAETNQVYIAQSPETFAYDDDGNQTLITTKTGLWRVTYNGENRPIRWACFESDNHTISNQKILSMSYDYMGRRREKNGRRFFYDGYLQVVNNQMIADQIVEQLFAWDATEPVATRPLYWQSCTMEECTSLFYTHDGNKNISEVVDVKCGVAAHYEYAVFGECLKMAGSCSESNPWRFSSEFTDKEHAFLYYNFRFADPVRGVWLSRDVADDGDDGARLYDYCCNDPVSMVDILGEWSSPDAIPSDAIPWIGDLLAPILPNDHEELMSAVEEASGSYFQAYPLPDVLSREVFNILKRANQGMDTGDNAGNDAKHLPLHFNRTKEKNNEFDAIKTYQNGLKRERAQNTGKYDDLKACTDAIEALGRVTHMLQDYYGHGVSWKKERARRRRRGKVKYYYTIIGRPFGDPDTTNPTEATIMKPSSYAGKWGHSEHGPIWAPEPGNLRFATQRRNAAIDKTKQELSKWLPNWCRDCACLFLKSLGY